ncbi:MAG: hypothetical protein ACXAEU_17265 [Candidatus Hodarchaeales archaeon]
MKIDKISIILDTFDGRLNALRNMREVAGNLISAGDIDEVYQQLVLLVAGSINHGQIQQLVHLFPFCRVVCPLLITSVD